MKNSTEQKQGCDLCTCAQCCAQIPESAAITAEGADYVRHFCGQACYEKWQAQQKQNQED